MKDSLSFILSYENMYCSSIGTFIRARVKRYTASLECYSSSVIVQQDFDPVYVYFSTPTDDYLA